MTEDPLYGQALLDHARRPRNRGRITGSTHRCVGHNPLCGDRVELWLRLDEGQVVEARFDGEGCAVCLASASMLVERIDGERTDALPGLVEAATRAIEGQETDDPALAPLAAVGDYPTRARCARLAWATLTAALEGRPGPVATE